MCVSIRHGLVIITAPVQQRAPTSQLYIYSLSDGSLLREMGARGRNEGQLQVYHGGLCITPDGDSVLVAEYHNDRVQEIRVVESQHPHVRFIGLDDLICPQFVDCNNKVIVVSEALGRISVLSWHTGDVVLRFDPTDLYSLRGVRLLQDGTGLVAADMAGHQLCLMSFRGDCLRLDKTMGGGDMQLDFTLRCPFDVLEMNSSVVVAYLWAGDLMKISDTGEIGVFDMDVAGVAVPKFDRPTALAALPDGGFVVRDCCGQRLQVFRGLALRALWITLSAMFE